MVLLLRKVCGSASIGSRFSVQIIKLVHTHCWIELGVLTAIFVHFIVSELRVGTYHSIRTQVKIVWSILRPQQRTLITWKSILHIVNTRLAHPLSCPVVRFGSRVLWGGLGRSSGNKLAHRYVSTHHTQRCTALLEFGFVLTYLWFWGSHYRSGTGTIDWFQISCSSPSSLNTLAFTRLKRLLCSATLPLGGLVFGCRIA